MSVGIFIFGILVTSIVAGACWLIATGIFDERRDRMDFEAEHAPEIETGHERRVATREDGRTVTAD